MPSEQRTLFPPLESRQNSVFFSLFILAAHRNTRLVAPRPSLQKGGCGPGLLFTHGLIAVAHHHCTSDVHLITGKHMVIYYTAILTYVNLHMWRVPFTIVVDGVNVTRANRLFESAATTS